MMMAKFHGIFVVALLYILQDALSTVVCYALLLTVPRNSITVIGDRVELECSTNSKQSVIWTFTSFETSRDTDIYINERISLPFASRYRIDKRISGQHNLIIDPVDLNHTGKYQCIEITTGNKTVAHLTVLHSSLKCSVNTSNSDEGIKENGSLWLWCRVEYFGSMTPIFNWTKASIRSQHGVHAIVTDRSTNNHVHFTKTSSLRAQLRYEDNGVVFNCMIEFQLPNSFSGNAPDFEFTWNYTAIVLYAPRNLRIATYDDRLECSSSGNPTPNYIWTNVETNRSTEGAVLLLGKTLDSDKERKFECTAVNTLGSQRKSVSILNNDSEDKSTLGTAQVALILASLSLTGFVVLGVGLGLPKLSSSFNAVRGFRHNDSFARSSFTQVITPSHGPQIELSTVEPNASLPYETVDLEFQTTSTGADYVPLKDRPPTVGDTQIYCELRLND